MIADEYVFDEHPKPQEIEDFLEAKVNLKLWVKVKKDWRDSDFLLKNFGFKEND